VGAGVTEDEVFGSLLLTETPGVAGRSLKRAERGEHGCGGLEVGRAHMRGCVSFPFPATALSFKSTPPPPPPPCSFSVSTVAPPPPHPPPAEGSPPPVSPPPDDSPGSPGDSPGDSLGDSPASSLVLGDISSSRNAFSAFFDNRLGKTERDIISRKEMMSPEAPEAPESHESHEE